MYYHILDRVFRRVFLPFLKSISKKKNIYHTDKKKIISKQIYTPKERPLDPMKDPLLLIYIMIRLL